MCVLAFMLVYYKIAGTVADFALIWNILLVLAILASLQATLTLPGIAGLILTVGMSIDANVIIFERIREELRKGKTPKAAIDSGVAKEPITNWKAYELELKKRLGLDNKLIRNLTSKAKRNPKKVVIIEAVEAPTVALMASRRLF